MGTPWDRRCLQLQLGTFSWPLQAFENHSRFPFLRKTLPVLPSGGSFLWPNMGEAPFAFLLMNLLLEFIWGNILRSYWFFSISCLPKGHFVPISRGGNGWCDLRSWPCKYKHWPSNSLACVENLCCLMYCPLRENFLRCCSCLLSSMPNL